MPLKSKESSPLNSVEPPLPPLNRALVGSLCFALRHLSEHAVGEEFIYRKGCDARIVSQLSATISEGILSGKMLKELSDIHCLASAVKQVLREHLPIIPIRLFETFTEPGADVGLLRAKLPPLNKALLSTLLEHSSEIVNNCHINKMNADSLARTLGTNVSRSAVNNDSLSEVIKRHALFVSLLKSWQQATAVEEEPFSGEGPGQLLFSSDEETDGGGDKRISRVNSGESLKQLKPMVNTHEETSPRSKEVARPHSVMYSRGANSPKHSPRSPSSGGSKWRSTISHLLGSPTNKDKKAAAGENGANAIPDLASAVIAATSQESKNAPDPPLTWATIASEEPAGQPESDAQPLLPEAESPQHTPSPSSSLKRFFGSPSRRRRRSKSHDSGVISIAKQLEHDNEDAASVDNNKDSSVASRTGKESIGLMTSILMKKMRNWDAQEKERKLSPRNGGAKNTTDDVSPLASPSSTSHPKSVGGLVVDEAKSVGGHVRVESLGANSVLELSHLQQELQQLEQRITAAMKANTSTPAVLSSPSLTEEIAELRKARQIEEDARKALELSLKEAHAALETTKADLVVTRADLSSALEGATSLQAQVVEARAAAEKEVISLLRTQDKLIRSLQAEVETTNRARESTSLEQRELRENCSKEAAQTILWKTRALRFEGQLRAMGVRVQSDDTTPSGSTGASPVSASGHRNVPSNGQLGGAYTSDYSWGDRASGTGTVSSQFSASEAAAATVALYLQNGLNTPPPVPSSHTHKRATSKQSSAVYLDQALEAQQSMSKRLEAQLSKNRQELLITKTAQGHMHTGSASSWIPVTPIHKTSDFSPQIQTPSAYFTPATSSLQQTRSVTSVVNSASATGSRTSYRAVVGLSPNNTHSPHSALSPQYAKWIGEQMSVPAKRPVSVAGRYS